MARFNNILETIGKTPLVKINKLAPDHVNLYVKLEYFNPMSSIKDRMAHAMIEEAEKSGRLKPGQTVVEATSGNTGIGLAMVCAQKGYPLVVTMAESNSIERRKLLRFLGAKVVLTPASEKGTGMIRKAEELAEKHDFFLTRQFDNPVNAEVHARTTAQEILDDFEHEPLHYWVSGFGTGGTLNGVAQGIKASRPEVQIVAVEPDNAQLLGSAIKQSRDEGGQPTASHPNFQPHLMQGWSPDFISSLTESAMAQGWVDEVVPVNGSESLRLSRELARQEGIFAGITSGATLAAAIQIARTAEPGSNIVCMIPDTGERYLSTPLFADITEEMTVDEMQLSESTPLCRFGPDGSPETVPATASEESLDSEVDRMVQKIIEDDQVVMFALEWCEFCWAARKFFNALGVPFRCIEIDSAANQANGVGMRIRKAVGRKTGVPTIPQIFIDGAYVGGTGELFDAWNSGLLAAKLKRLGLTVSHGQSIDPQRFLPGWVQPRKSA